MGNLGVCVQRSLLMTWGGKGGKEEQEEGRSESGMGGGNPWQGHLKRPEPRIMPHVAMLVLEAPRLRRKANLTRHLQVKCKC